jgi:hypothetical protein
MPSKDNPCELRAQIYFLNHEDKKLDFVETVPEIQQLQVREDARKMAEYIFKSLLGDYKEEYKINYEGLYINVEFYNFVSTSYIKDIVTALHDNAKTTYLNQDAKVYKDYSIIFDDFTYTCDRRLGAMKQSVIRYGNYWEWDSERPVIKEWDMWSSSGKRKEKDISISIRHNISPIPFASEVITRDKLIYFDWSDNSVALYSKNGFTVEDAILAIQDLITSEYEQDLGDILDEDQEIGSIDTLYFNPRTKHVFISVTFD